MWANADTLDATREELGEVLEELIALRLSKNLPIPSSAGPRFQLLPWPEASVPAFEPTTEGISSATSRN